MKLLSAPRRSRRSGSGSASTPTPARIPPAGLLHLRLQRLEGPRLVSAGASAAGEGPQGGQTGGQAVTPHPTQTGGGGTEAGRAATSSMGKRRGVRAAAACPATSGDRCRLRKARLTSRWLTVRRVRVTAVCFRTAFGTGMSGRRQVDSELAAPTESRTPTGTGAWRSTEECEWKQGDRDGRRYQRDDDRIQQNQDSGRGPRLRFPPPRSCASRPPVKALRRLASLGLDGARPRCGKSFLRRGNGRLCMAGSSCLPWVGAERRRLTEIVEQDT